MVRCDPGKRQRRFPEPIVRNRLRNSGAFRALFSRLREGLPMKSIITILAAGVLAGAFTLSADAAAKKSGAAQLQAQCQAQAKKRYSAIHFLKRRDYVKSCMHQKA
jgi:hydroxymethylglutaryl-CoA reductase